MTEKTALKGPVRLLSDCARLAGFDPAEGWRDELPVKGVISLLAGTYKLSNEGRKEWTRLVFSAIKRDKLTTIKKSRTIPGKTVKVGSMAGYNSFGHWANGLDPQVAYTQPPETIVTHYITRASLAAWLQAIGETTETLSACALAWLGPEWKEAPGAGAGAGAESSTAIERRKKEVMIKELESIWPSIKSDLRHACPGDKGLHDAAKLPEHGYWDKTAALRWAEENGKLVDSTSKPQGFAPPRTIKFS